MIFHDFQDALFAAVKLLQALAAALHDAGEPLQLCTWFR